MEYNGKSDVQQRIESVLFQKTEDYLLDDTLLSNPKVLIEGDEGVTIVPGFLSTEHGVVGEIYAHIGRIKPAQAHKIAADVLKMLLYEKTQGRRLKKYIVVCDEQVEDYLKGQSYLSAAISQFGVEVLYFPLEATDVVELKAAQDRQNIYNKTDKER